MQFAPEIKIPQYVKFCLSTRDVTAIDVHGKTSNIVRNIRDYADVFPDKALRKGNALRFNETVFVTRGFLRYPDYFLR